MKEIEQKIEVEEEDEVDFDALSEDEEFKGEDREEDDADDGEEF